MLGIVHTAARNVARCPVIAGVSVACITTRCINGHAGQFIAFVLNDAFRGSDGA